MNNYIENTYWIAIAHMPNWHTERINRLVIQVIHENKMSWQDFFELGTKELTQIFSFSEKERSDLITAKEDLPRIAFIAEQLQHEGFQLIPITSQNYPSVLKENLKVKNSPVVLYIRGRTGLLNDEVVAVVGSRKAGKAALDFTDQIAKKSVRESKVVVSGFAKGVDKQALDSTLEAKGKSIIVLPQGILTFQSGFKKYYQPIANGDVLVLSTFFPKAGWDVGLAMARNATIYGLAQEIYVAESDNKGGTWEGVKNGLARHRKIFVRNPEPGEKNANHILIDLGGIPVNREGEPVNYPDKIKQELFTEHSAETFVNETAASYPDSDAAIGNRILEFLGKGDFTSKEICLALKLDWDSRRLTRVLKSNPSIRVVEGKPAKFGLNTTINPTLFS